MLQYAHCIAASHRAAIFVSCRLPLRISVSRGTFKDFLFIS